MKVFNRVITRGTTFNLHRDAARDCYRHRLVIRHLPCTRQQTSRFTFGDTVVAKGIL